MLSKAAHYFTPPAGINTEPEIQVKFLHLGTLGLLEKMYSEHCSPYCQTLLSLM